MSNELLSPAEMSEADRLTIAAGPADGIGLMRRAGGAVAAEVLKRYPSAKHIHVLCGPGNNGGDGYVVARILAGSGVGTSVWASGAPRPKSDAALAAAECPIKPRPLSDFDAKPGSIVIDALYGAGLSKPLSGDAAKAIDTVTALSLPVVAVDLPSGVSGRSGDILGRAFRAEVTITFARKKPGHLLLPGRGQCGEIVLAD
ncbi:NAD(P)H-hydrate epimerase, partial [Mesorhizobium sp. M7A.F.Ca.US.001.02.1.1]